MRHLCGPSARAQTSSSAVSRQWPAPVGGRLTRARRRRLESRRHKPQARRTTSWRLAGSQLGVPDARAVTAGRPREPGRSRQADHSRQVTAGRSWQADHASQAGHSRQVTADRSRQAGHASQAGHGRQVTRTVRTASYHGARQVTHTGRTERVSRGPHTGQ